MASLSLQDEPHQLHERRPMRFGKFAALFAVFAIGFFGFSQIGYHLSVRVFGLPFYSPEPFFLILAVALLRASKPPYRTRLTKITVGASFVYLIIWALLVTIAVFSYDLRDVLSAARPYLFIWLGLILASCLRDIDRSYILTFLLGVLIAEFVNTQIAPYIITGFRGITSVNLLAVYFAISMAVLSRSSFWIVLMVSTVSLLIPFTGFRAVIAVALISLLASFAIRAYKDGSFGSYIRGFLWISAALTLSAFVLRAVFLQFDINQFAAFRLVNRILGFFHGGIEASQDERRVDNFIKYLKDPGGIFPDGFVMVGRSMIGAFNDVPFLNFTYTLGLPIGILVISAIFLAGLSHCVKTLSGSKRAVVDDVGCAGIFVFIFLFLINGRFLYIAYEAMFFGFLLGTWLTRSPTGKQSYCAVGKPIAITNTRKNRVVFG